MLFSKRQKVFWASFLFFYSAILLWTILVVNRQLPMYMAEAKAIIWLETESQLPEGLGVLPGRGQFNPTPVSFPIPEEFLRRVIQKLTLVPEWGSLAQYQDTLSGLEAQTDIRYVNGDAMVRVRALSKDPAEAKRVADALAAAFAAKINVTRILPADLPEKPLRPKKSRNLLVASLVGLVIALPAAHLIQEGFHPVHEGEKT